MFGLEKTLYRYSSYPIKTGGKLRRTLLIAVVAVIVVIMVMSYVGWTGLNTNNPTITPQPSTTPQVSQTPELSPTMAPSSSIEVFPSPSSSPVPLTQEQIRDAAMDYIKTYHSKTSEFMENLTWTGGRATAEGLVGTETYTYTSSNWTVTSQYPVVLDPIYKITVNYSATDILISWEGTCENRTMKEINYTFSDTRGFSTQERVREAVMSYIKTNHAETASYMQSLMWTGGKISQGMILGSETYIYESYGWNVTMQYPVYPNPIYTITVSYISLISQITPQKNILSWQGTWQNGTITETTYTFTP
jgi:hypothetical protein